MFITVRRFFKLNALKGKNLRFDFSEKIAGKEYLYFTFVFSSINFNQKELTIHQ